MFEASLVASRRPTQGGRRGLLPLAFAVHGLVLASVLLAQAWSVERVPAPTNLNLPFVQFLPPPPPAGGPATPTRPTVQHPAVTTTPTVAPAVTQPNRVPDVIPLTPPTPVDPVIGDLPTIPGALPGTGEGPRLGTGEGPGAGLGETPVVIGEGIVPPTLLRRIVPAYTEAARRGHLQGVVLLKGVIGTDGAVTNVRLLRGLGLGLDENAIEAVRQWRYAPARFAKTGRALPVYLDIAVHYELR